MGAQQHSGLLPTTRPCPANRPHAHSISLVAAGSWEQRWWTVGVLGGQGTGQGALVGRRPSQEGSNLPVVVITVVRSPLTLCWAPCCFDCLPLLHLSKSFEA